MTPRNWAKHTKDMATQQQQAAAEGQARPEPGLTPPLTYDEHFAARFAQINNEQEQPDSE